MQRTNDAMNTNNSNSSHSSKYNASSADTAQPQGDSIDISKIMQHHENIVSAASTVAYKDVVVLVGNTGVGKSTTIHFMVGSTLTYDPKTRHINAFYPEVAKDIEISSSVTSATKHFSGIDLSQSKQLHIDYKLKTPLFLCDTPGFGDTAGVEATINNAITIVHPLQMVNSARILVLFSFSQLDERGTGIYKTLESVVRFIPDVHLHTKAIYYCFTGNPRNGDSEMVRTTLKDLLANQENLKYSNGVNVLLKDMQSKYTNSICIINPIGKTDSITPKKLMDIILGLTPITNPKQAIVPFIEEQAQAKLTNQLNTLFSTFQQKLENIKTTVVKKNSDQERHDKLTDDLKSIQTILNQLKFINTFLKRYDPNRYFVECENLITELHEFFIEKVNLIFDATNIIKTITEDDIKQFQLILFAQNKLLPFFKEDNVQSSSYVTTTTSFTSVPSSSASSSKPPKSETIQFCIRLENSKVDLSLNHLLKESFLPDGCEMVMVSMDSTATIADLLIKVRKQVGIAADGISFKSELKTFNNYPVLNSDLNAIESFTLAQWTGNLKSSDPKLDVVCYVVLSQIKHSPIQHTYSWEHLSLWSKKYFALLMNLDVFHAENSWKNLDDNLKQTWFAEFKKYQKIRAKFAYYFSYPPVEYCNDVEKAKTAVASMIKIKIDELKPDITLFQAKLLLEEFDIQTSYKEEMNNRQRPNGIWSYLPTQVKAGKVEKFYTKGERYNFIRSQFTTLIKDKKEEKKPEWFSASTTLVTKDSEKIHSPGKDATESSSKQETKHVDNAADEENSIKDERKETVYAIAKTYHDTVLTKLDQINEFYSLKFQHQLLSQAASFSNFLMVATPHLEIELPTVKLEWEDSQAESRIKPVLNYFECTFDELSQKEKEVKNKLDSLQKECESFSQITAIQIMISNAVLIEKFAFLSIPIKRVNQQFLETQIAAQVGRFKEAIQCNDFNTAATLLIQLKQALVDPQEKKLLQDHFMVMLSQLIPAQKMQNSSSFKAWLLEKENTKHYIYIIKILVDLDTAFAGKVSKVTDMYQQLTTELTGHFQQVITSITQVVGVEENITGINELHPLLQQLAYILSIPFKQEDADKLHLSYVTIREKVKTFVSGFRQRFSSQLEEIKVAEVLYANTHLYFTCLDNAWIRHLDLTDNKTKLIESVEKRLQTLTKDFDPSEEITSWDIFQDKEKIDELVIIQSVLNDYLPHNKVFNCINVFNQKINRILEFIAKQCQGEMQYLNLSDFTNFADYIKKCVEYKLFPEQVENIKSILQNAIKRWSAQQLVQVQKHLAILAEWQAAEGLYHPLVKDIPDLLKQLIEIFSAIRQLKQTLPDYYQRSDNPQAKCEKLLQDNLGYFAQQMSLALTKRFENNKDIKAAEQIEKLVSLCSQLSPLDAYLPTEVDLEIKKYSSLSKKYEKSLGKTYLHDFTEILLAVRNRRYDEALTTSVKLANEAGIKQILCKQTSAIITQFAEQVVKDTTLLGQSASSAPESLTSLSINFPLLEEAKTLKTVGLLNETALAHCDKVLANIQSATDQWFANCLSILNQCVQNFTVQSYNQTFPALQATINSIPIKPTDWDTKFHALKQALDEKLQSVADGFNQPMTEWSTHPYTLAFIQQQLITKPESWLEVSARVHQACMNQANKIQAEIVTSSITHSIDAIQLLEKQIIDLPSEYTQLREKGMQLVKDCLLTLNKKILNSRASFPDYVANIGQLMSGKNKIKTILTQKELSNLVSPLQEEVTQLCTRINQALDNNQFPSPEFFKLITIYEAVTDFKEIIQDKLLVSSGHLETFITNIFTQLTSNLANYQLNSNTLPAILNSWQLLTQMNQCRATMDQKKKELFDGLLPAHFYSAFEQHLKNVLKIMNDRYESFLLSLNQKDVSAINSYLNFILAWGKTSAEITTYIAAGDETERQQSPISDLVECLTNSNYTSLCEKIQGKISGLIKDVTLNISTYFSLPETGEANRKAYFAKVIQVMSFIVDCKKLGSHFSVVHHEANLLKATHDYLLQLYMYVLDELKGELKSKNWERVANCYKDLMLFASQCQGYPQHLGSITLGVDSRDSILAIKAINKVDTVFQQLLDDAIIQLKLNIDPKNDTVELKSKIVSLVINLQQIIDTFPQKTTLTKKILADFLTYIREQCGMNYFQVIMAELQKNDIGLKTIDQQACFSGISIAIRNTRTDPQGIDYVLKEVKEKNGSVDITPLDAEEAGSLKELYNGFKITYDKLLTEYLNPEKGFNDHSSKFLKQLVTELQSFVADKPSSFDAENKIIWNEVIRSKIPTMMAYLFTIWTLRDSGAYFGINSDRDNQNYLKKAHPGQVIAIFRMLNMNGKQNSLPSHLVQVLSGEGKSIVIAITASILALCGYSVSCACYSKYLSSRDFADFEGMFKLLEVDTQIKYGTFNSLCEDILNSHGSIRELTENIIKTGAPQFASTRKSEEPSEKRPNVVIADEVDVFFHPEFYGALYNPSLDFKDTTISDLIEFIWNKHTSKKPATLSLHEITDSIPYQTCASKWQRLKPLLEKAIEDMLRALSLYTHENGHTYSVMDNKIVYPYHDGMTSDISKGYKTMWAYFAERDQHKITAAAVKENTEIAIRCGFYAYSKVLKEMGAFNCILGVTGTLRELSEAEQKIIREEFSIVRQTFIPSVYGPNRLLFPKKESVFVENEDFYYSRLAQEISTRQKGVTSDTAIRPIIVFFKTYSELMNFYNSEALKKSGIKTKTRLMTQGSSTTKEEQDIEIILAMEVGAVTLAVQEKGRGRDFKYPPIRIIEDNGGVHVILAFFPEHASLETQLNYRTARQGLPGSASMLLNEKDLKEQFALKDDDIQAMRDNNNVYDTLDAARKLKFAKSYSERAEEMITVREKLHIPSVNFWKKLCAPGSDPQEILNLLLEVNQVSTPNLKTTVGSSHTLILIDATASMRPTIEGVKKTITNFLLNLDIVLAANKIAANNVALQIAIYRSYFETEQDIFKCSEWSNNANVLQAFIDKINAFGGSLDGGKEAIEVGLCHALKEVGTNHLTQVVLIGDMPGTPVEKLESTDPGVQERLSKHQGKFYSNCGSTDDLTKKLKKVGVPVFAFFVDQRQSTVDAFKKIAADTDGKSEFLDVTSPKAHENLNSMFGVRVLSDVAGKDEKKQAQLIAQFGEISQRRNN